MYCKATRVTNVDTNFIYYLQESFTQIRMTSGELKLLHLSFYKKKEMQSKATRI